MPVLLVQPSIPELFETQVEPTFWEPLLLRKGSQNLLGTWFRLCFGSKKLAAALFLRRFWALLKLGLLVALRTANLCRITQ
jgi:hypothetical protein